MPEEPIVFLKSAWMDYYDGRIGDLVVGTHAFVQATGSGAEINNFKKRGRYCYGYAPFNNKRMALHKHLPDVAKGADYIDGVTIAWIAKAPDSRGVVVVGWYEHARLYAEYQEYPNPEGLPCLARAHVTNCHRVPPDDRTLKIEKGIRSGSVWYAPDRTDLKRSVRKLIAGTYRSTTTPTNVHRSPADRSRILDVERAAINAVIDHFSNRGFEVVNREKENEGWDLVAIRDTVALKLEVKGTSQRTINAELTPNEYEKARSNPNTYRICIVTSALDAPKVNVFRFSNESKSWKDETGELTLAIQELVGARLTARR